MKSISAIWQFSRPHTIIGTSISLISLYIILCRERFAHYPLLIMVLIAGLASNLFIVGINQIADVHIDKINKPLLPIPAQKLTIGLAWIVVIGALIISLGIALYMTPWFFGVIIISSAIGWAYSMPPFHLKAHHLTAALAISSVRGPLVNLGAFIVFQQLVDKNAPLPVNLITLTCFITLCGIVIAWFKDLPDIAGDAKYNIRTFAVLYTPKTALIAGSILMSVAYMITICINALTSPDVLHSYNRNVLLYGHIGLLVAFILNSLTIRLRNQRSITRFYKRFWLFFFAEYLLYLFAYL